MSGLDRASETQQINDTEAQLAAAQAELDAEVKSFQADARDVFGRGEDLERMTRQAAVLRGQAPRFAKAGDLSSASVLEQDEQPQPVEQAKPSLGERAKQFFSWLGSKIRSGFVALWKKITSCCSCGKSSATVEPVSPISERGDDQVPQVPAAYAATGALPPSPLAQLRAADALPGAVGDGIEIRVVRPDAATARAMNEVAVRGLLQRRAGTLTRLAEAAEGLVDAARERAEHITAATAGMR